MFKYAAPDSYAVFTNKKSITFLINVFPKQILIEDKMNREMLKEAIAEAKTIKETAIASAKAALEEAFTPQLTAMFAEKLNEMDEKELEETKEMEKETYSMEEEGLEEDFNLEEILAELGEDEDDVEEGVYEAEGDMDDMDMPDDETLEMMIKNILDQEIKAAIEAGEIEAGDNYEKDEEGDDEEELDVDAEIDTDDTDEEVSIEELLAEIDSLEEKEELEEVGYVDPGSAEWISQIGQFFGGLSADQVMAMVAALPVAVVGAAFAKTPIANAIKKLKAKVGSSSAGEADTKEMEETIAELRSELNEVNLLNAKLLYTNKIFKSKNLTESEKVKVLNTFDKAETVKEVKLVFETLTESLKATASKVSPIKESLGGASKTIAAAPKQQEQIIEVNDAFARMQRLAGLRK